MLSKKIFVTDCEGPISKNDNAFELSSYLIPNGDNFFALVSEYDAFLADISRKPDYKAGDTLKVILPFLKAYGATNDKMKEYSSRNILLIPGAADTLKFVDDTMYSFIVSTSYEQYISALCEVMGSPYENVYCTKLDLDKYKISESEIDKLKEIGEEVASMPIIEMPDGAKSINDFSERDIKTIKRLDEIFWEEMPKLESGRMLEEVNPVGGYEKAIAVKDIVEKLDAEFCDVMYVGDSITDVQPFQLVKGNGGLTVSFNGNSYAIREAEIAVLADNTVITSVLADLFNSYDREKVIELVENWNFDNFKDIIHSKLSKTVAEIYPGGKLPKVELITETSRDRLTKESSTYRKTIRGEAIGKLG